MYTPNNGDVYLRAGAGFMAGITSPATTDTNTGDYFGYALMACAYAQAVDTAWGGASVTTLELLTIEEVSEAIWENRSPLTATAASPESYTQIALSVVARARALNAQVVSAGIDPNGAGSGGGGGTVTVVTGSAPIAITGSSTAPNVTLAAATESLAGSMSPADKAKLDGLPMSAIAAPAGPVEGDMLLYTGGAWSLLAPPTTGTAYQYVTAIQGEGGRTIGWSQFDIPARFNGSLLVFDSGLGSWNSLSPGNTGQILTLVGDWPEWQNPRLASRFTIAAAVVSTGNSNTLPKKVGAISFDPAIWRLQGTSTVVLHVLLETTNAGNAASLVLNRLTGTGAPAVITTLTTASLTTTELTVDLSVALSSTSASGVFVLLLSLATTSGTDLATVSGAWLEIDT